ncbi:MAG TPA: homoserine dehydrogenase [Candidatus Limnocylindria bacterium]|nr:homoserine dehydrogenase [Candidatus Limnocylindria bacterium]
MRIAILGFGHVGRALARLLVEQRGRHPFVVTAIVTQRHGNVTDARGIDLGQALARESFGGGSPLAVAMLDADAVVDLTPLDARTGGPGLAYVREALASGRHVVTSNKGPIALAYRELSALARERGVLLRFEATVADCLPLFDLARAALPLAEIRSIRGVLNSTTNGILSAAARGVPFADALADAQRLGIAEADPRNDLEGWDAAAKAAILANVLMGTGLAPLDVARTPIGEDAAALAREAVTLGERVRPVVELVRDGDRVRATFGPVRLGPLDPLYAVDGFSLGAVLDTDLAGRVAVQLHEPHVAQTAYAVFTDLLDVAAVGP